MRGSEERNVGQASGGELSNLDPAIRDGHQGMPDET